jgi:hypothetical protein
VRCCHSPAQFTIAYVHHLADIEGVFVDSVATLFANLAAWFVSATGNAARRTHARAVYARVCRQHSELRRTTWSSALTRKPATPSAPGAPVRGPL